MFLFGLLTSASATACGYYCTVDDSCPSVQRMDEWCDIDRQFIDPFNAPRTNLILLVSDSAGQAPDSSVVTEQEANARPAARIAQYQAQLAQLAADEPARTAEDWRGRAPCPHTDAASAYLQALQDAKLSEANRRSLAVQRNRLLCLDVQERDARIRVHQAILALQSDADETTRLYAQYLLVVEDFEAGELNPALARLETLQRASDPWIAETADMLQGRLLAIRAQRNWNGYGNNASQLDQADLAAAASHFEAYMQRYPQGRYRNSIRGLQRRLLRIARHPDYIPRLEQDLRFMIEWHAPMSDLLPIINESPEWEPFGALRLRDNQLEGGLGEPHLYAVAVLDYLRQRERQHVDDSAAVIAALEAHDALLAQRPGLKAFLLAQEAATRGDWTRARQWSKQVNAPEASALAIATDIVAATAAEASEDPDEAIALWSRLQRLAQDRYPKGFNGSARVRALADTLAIGLARAALNSNRPELIYRRGGAMARPGPVTLYVIRTQMDAEMLGKALADPALAEDLRPAMRNALLWRQLLERSWGAFLNTYDHLPSTEQTPFHAVETAVRTLRTQPQDAKALLNVGYFLERSGRYAPQRGFVCNSPKLLSLQIADFRQRHNRPPLGVPAHPNPLDFYRDALAQDPAPDLKAKVLYHAIRCFRFSAQCGLNDVPAATRKSWFDTLKRDHATSPWAQRTQYWY
jgi:tetratricopeptide (TPR) repeat protein